MNEDGLKSVLILYEGVLAHMLGPMGKDDLVKGSGLRLAFEIQQPLDVIRTPRNGQNC